MFTEIIQFILILGTAGILTYAFRTARLDREERQEIQLVNDAAFYAQNIIKNRIRIGYYENVPVAVFSDDYDSLFQQYLQEH